MIKQLAIRTLGGAAAMLLVAWALAAPAWAHSTTKEGVVPPPTLFDSAVTDNCTILGVCGMSHAACTSDTDCPLHDVVKGTAFPSDSGSPSQNYAVCSTIVDANTDPTCGGVCNTNFWGCKEGDTCTGPGGLWSPADGAAAAGTGYAGQCHATHCGTTGCTWSCAGNGCTTNAECLPFPLEICTYTSPPDGAKGTPDIPTEQGGDVTKILNGEKSGCQTDGTKIQIKAVLEDTTVATGLMSNGKVPSHAGVCQGGAPMCDVVNVCKAGAGNVCKGSPLKCSKSANTCTSNSDCPANYCKTLERDGSAESCTTNTDCGFTCRAGYNKGQVCEREADCLCLKNGDCGSDGTIVSTCSNKPKKKCTLDADCGTGATCGGTNFALSPVPGLCWDGSEYIAGVDSIMEVVSNSCLQSGCLLAFFTGAPGSSGGCIIGTCNAAGVPVRVNQACQHDIDCNPLGPTGATCSGPGNIIAASDMPTKGSYFSNPAGTAVPLCPFEFRLDFPMEMAKGVGQVKIDTYYSVLGGYVQNGTSINSVACNVREPGAVEFSQIGLYTPACNTGTHTCMAYSFGSTNALSEAKGGEMGLIPCAGDADCPLGSSMGGRPDPNALIPLPTSGQGTWANEGIGAIIGVMGQEQ